MTTQATSQQVRYPGMAPANPWAQGLMGGLQGAGGFLSGMAAQRAALQDRQSKQYNATVPALINKGYMGPVSGMPSTIPGIPGLGATIPTPDASDVLARMRTKKLGQEIGDPNYPMSPQQKRMMVEAAVDKTLLSDSEYRSQLTDDPSLAALIRENSIKVQLGEITSDEAKAALEKEKVGAGKKWHDFIRPLDFVSPLFRLFGKKPAKSNSFNKPQLVKPPHVPDADWNMATDEQKQALLNALGY